MNINKKEIYGLVYTSKKLVDEILDLIPIKYFCDPSLKWLDIGCGNGAFCINLYNRLYINLKNKIKDDEKRKNHIIKNMIYMIEILEEHVENLRYEFGNNANIIHGDYLKLENNKLGNYNFIIGNPPFNSNGLIKTPTNTNKNKIDDGRAIYKDFIKKSIDLLDNEGYLNVIIPSLWLKPDKYGLYNILTNMKIIKLVCMSSSKTNKLFNYKAQTPTCYFLIQKNKHDDNKNNFLIYDNINNDYIEYNLLKNFAIPTNGICIINKLLKYVSKYGYINVNKTSTISNKSKISNVKDASFNYINVRTCILEKKLYPKLIFHYSNNELKYYNIPKIILANKMYGFPFFDISGIYGISTRDNYIISNDNYNLNELNEIFHFLSTKFALFIFSTTNYRMRLLEKYTFEFLPNIIKISNFPKLKNLTREYRDIKIYEFFNLSENEINYIEKYSKNYKFFI